MTTEAATVFGGRYEMHRRVARGGMAEVYLAKDQLLDRWVAIKVLFPQFAADPSFVERFRREAQAAAKLSHPNIVAVYDWGEEDGTYFIVMEYVEGRSLSQIIKQDGRMSADRAADIAVDVAKGLGYAHSKGFVHLDTKSANVLLSEKGEIKVADFGISKAIAGGMENLTATGLVMGTASYFSPEQAQGQTVGPQSDLYSLGIVLFEMVTGKTPFTAESPVAIAYKHVQEPPPDHSEFGVEVPPVFAAINRKLLAKSPDNRYADAADLISDLKRFRSGEQFSAAGQQAGSPPSYGPAPTPVRVDGQPQPVPVGATTAMPALGAQRPQPSYYEPPADRRSTGAIVMGFILALAIVAGIGIMAFILSSNQNEPTETETVTATVPNVLGLDQDAATQELQNADLRVEFSRVANSEVAAGQVFDQDPPGETTVDPGSTVTISVSTGTAPRTIPNVRDIQFEAGVQQLEAQGFVVERRNVPNDSVRAGQIIDQNPPPNEQRRPGSLVILDVSSGPSTATVPEVAAFTIEAAIESLERSGFRVVQEGVLSDEVSVGFVVGTEPPNGSSLRKGETVVLQISEGAERILVPDVTGFRRDDAISILQGQGFGVLIRDFNTSIQTENGVVVGQNPLADSPVEKGSDVLLDVGLFTGGSTTGGAVATCQLPDGTIILDSDTDPATCP